jgi:CHAD domain-containing protein
MISIRNYFKEQIKIFDECHARLSINKDEKNIHKLRTTLKRLRTLNILLDEILLRQKKFPENLTELFKSVGEVREVQINNKILKEFDSDIKIYFLYLLKDKINKLKIKEDFEEDKEYLISKLNKALSKYTENETFLIIKNYIKNLEKEIRLMINDVSKDNLHDIRKKIKRVYYTNIMLGLNIDNIENLNQIQEHIGLWHDYDVTIDLIKNLDKDHKILDVLIKKRDSLFNESLELLSLL